MTKLAKELLRIIQNSDKHMTAEEIFMLCKDEEVQISFASVYRNLTNLLDEGFIRKVSIAGEADRFDKTVRPHDHVFCSKCKKLSDVNVGDLTPMFEEELGTDIEDYALLIRYICPECRAKA